MQNIGHGKRFVLFGHLHLIEQLFSLPAGGFCL